MAMPGREVECSTGGAGVESAGDSPQGKSIVVQPRQDGFYVLRSTPPCLAQNERDKERDERKLDGACSAVEGPSGVSTGATKAKVRVARYPQKSPTRLRILGREHLRKTPLYRCISYTKYLCFQKW
jgi:hypothetical protein